jgi:hypothetical protein
MPELVLSVLAWVVLVSPEELPWPLNTIDLRAEMIRQAEGRGLMEGEEPNIHCYNYSVPGILRERYANHQQGNVPPALGDAARLPSFEEAQAQLRLHTEMRRTLWDVMVIGGYKETEQPWFGFWESMAQRRALWTIIAFVANPDVPAYPRREKLALLRDLLGVKAYYEGDYPSILPLEALPYTEALPHR